MFANIGLYSYGAAFLAYSLLTALVFLTRRSGALGLPLLTATTLTAIWAGAVVASTLAAHPLIHLMQLAEIFRNAAWSFLLLRMLARHLEHTNHILASGRWISWFIAGFAIILALLFGPELLGERFPALEVLRHHTVYSLWLAMSVLGMLLLEQLFRNVDAGERWSIKHLCLGLGVIFAYDFFMYAEALLFRQVNAAFWQSRGIVTAFSAIFLAVAIGRIDRSHRSRQLYLSRHVVFHSVTLLAAGVYLLMMALAGYFIRYLGGTWGVVLQIAFLCASGLVLLALLFSGQIRARTRVWLSKNFFSYKYDYRIEWLQFTQTLTEVGANIPETVIRAVAHITRSPGGLLWNRGEGGQYELAASWAMAEPAKGDELGTLPSWMQQTEWIVDLREWRRSPDLYDGLDLPPFLLDIARAWLLIPLMLGERLQGILLLRESDLQLDLNWEDRDLLKVAGRQAASHLAQYQAHLALIESRQFEAFNRLSAYVIHDLKNILAQQSLIVSNAEKHRNNPAFVDDVLSTVRNSVARMTRLMQQMRSGVRGAGNQQVRMSELLHEVVANRAGSQPVPALKICAEDVLVAADREQLATVFNHIIQNGQEATIRTGRVEVRLLRDDNVAVVEVEDDGTGMDEHFIRTRLFKPFDSTKGLTGMGIGAFESREFVRTLGGDIQVSSSPGAGSLFRIFLPCSESQAQITHVERKTQF
jgi:putative PEP-CTERM system histidine kinase